MPVAWDLQVTSARIWEGWQVGIKLELGKANPCTARTISQMTQETVVGYEFEVSEDLTLHWLMTVFSGMQA